LTPNTLMR